MGTMGPPSIENTPAEVAVLPTHAHWKRQVLRRCLETGTQPCSLCGAPALIFVDEELTAELWMHEVFYGKHLVQGCLIKQSLLQNQLLDALAGL